MHDPAGTGSRQISRAQAAEPRSRRGFPTRALLKSPLTHIEIMAAEKGRRAGRTQQIPAGSRTQTSSPASKVPFDLQGGTGSLGAGRDVGRPGAASRSLLCPAPPLPCCTSESSDLFSQKPTRRTQWVSFVQQQRQMQTQLSPRRNISTSRGRGEKGKGEQCRSPTSHLSPGKEEGRTSRSTDTTNTASLLGE